MGRLIISLMIFSMAQVANAEPIKASWYSVESLKKEGSWKLYKGVQANGTQFNDDKDSVASRMHDLGTHLLVTNLDNGKSVKVEVTDRIGRRFAQTRIDLSKGAFAKISDLNKGVIPVKIEAIQ